MQLWDFLQSVITGKLFSARELAAVRNEVSFSEAIAAHLSWKLNLTNALAGRAERMPNPDEIGDDTRCILGQWIHGPGQERYGYFSSYAELRQRHEHFHHLARQVVELTREERRGDAQRLLEGEFQEASRDIIAHLKLLSSLFGS